METVHTLFSRLKGHTVGIRCVHSVCVISLREGNLEQAPVL